jgi:hypothetical protein
MTAIPTTPDEDTPLLGGNKVSAIEGAISESPSSSETATLAGHSNQASRTPSIKGKVNEVSKPIKKTPLPWAQFSIIMFLHLAEPLTSQVIYPVSYRLGYCFGASNRASNVLIFFSLHLRSVWILWHVPRNILIFFAQLIRNLNIAKNDAEVGYYVGMLVSC